MFWKVFDSLEDWFLIVTLGAMMILNFANVVSRYLLSTSIAFTEELTTNLFVWSCFIGAAAAAKRGAHLGFSLVVDSMPGLARRWVAALVTLLTLGMFGIMFVLSLDMIETQIMLKQETPALGMPEWIVSLAIPVGAAFCFIRFAQAGWLVQDMKQLNLAAGMGVAVREYPTDSGPADYVLFVGRHAVGVIEAKKDSAGENLTVTENQTERYATANLKWRKDNTPLRFLFEATGQIIRFTDNADPAPRSREIFHFFKPETLATWWAQPDTLRRRRQKRE